MTTIDAAAAWRVKNSVTSAVFAALLSLGLGGCETGTGIFGGSQAVDLAGSQPAAATPTTPAQKQMAKIAIAPIIGPPEAVERQIVSQMKSAIEMQRVSVASQPGEAAEFTLRGYVVSAREKTRTKISYIWDVTDQSGKRVNRITGEESVVGPAQKDPWAAVSPKIASAIATKTANSIVAWVPQAPASTGAGTPMASAPTGAGTAQVQPTAVSQPTPAAQPVTYTPAAGAGATQPAPGRLMAMVPSVVGAPGDGSISLTGAIQRELSNNGLSLTETATGQAYKVEGKVVVGAGENGRQPIQIDWAVKDATGKKLGTVSQKNEVAQGSLDGAWGKVAEAAASAAAPGIMKLVQQHEQGGAKAVGTN